MRQQVVVDPQAAHRRQVTYDDAAGYETAHLGALADSGLEPVQGLATQLQALGVFFVPLADLRVDVPAAEVERLANGRDLGDREVFDVDETDHDIGHLNAGVVDVVLHLDRDALGAQSPHQQVAEHGIPQVADVRRLVGIDVGVLDDDLARHGGARGAPGDRGARGDRSACGDRGTGRGGHGLGEDRRGEQTGGKLRAVEEKVQVTRTFDAELAHPGGQAPPGSERRRDVAGLHFQRLGKVQRGREGEVAEGPPGRNLGDGVVVEAELAANFALERVGELAFQSPEHGGAVYLTGHPSAGCRRGW